MSTEEIVTLIHSDPLCTGITYSGGEPFLQAKDLIPLTKILKDEGYEVAAYSGYRFEELLMGTCDQLELLSYIDVLIDGPFDLKQKSLDLKFRGSRNQRILNVQESLRKGEAVFEESRRWKLELLSRQDLIDSFKNDDDGTPWNMDEIIYRLEQFPSAQEVKEYLRKAGDGNELSD